MVRAILFITDLTNGETEDLITVDYLKRYYDVSVSYFDKLESIEDDFDLIIVRDTWPVDESKFQEYNLLRKNFLLRAKEKGLKIYNTLDAKGDRAGKDYLINLYNNNFPVIPTIDSIDYINRLPASTEYYRKPKNGFSAYGLKVISPENIKNIVLDNEIIQPKLSFKYEISFYFVDKELVYCLIFEPSKVPDYPDPKVYIPTANEITFALQFVNWNNMTAGITRIDALRLADDSLILLEIEDDSPYFSLTEIPKELQNKFLKAFTESIRTYIQRLSK